MAVIRYLGMLAVALVIILLAIYNADNVTFNFFSVKSWQAPLILMLFITLVIGIVLGMFFSFLKSFSKKRQVKKSAAVKDQDEEDVVVAGLQNVNTDSTLSENASKASDNVGLASSGDKKPEDKNIEPLKS